MKNVFITVFSFSALLMFAPLTSAQTFDPVSFEDQHGNSLELNEQVSWVIFSHNNDGAKVVKEAIDQTGLTDFARYQGIYIADISKMPGLVTRLFAMPAMRKYEFRMALDREGNLTQDFPRSADQVTLLKLSNLKLVEQAFVTSPDDVVEFINTNR